MAKSPSTTSNIQREHQWIEVTDARGAQRVGLIWMLVTSTGMAATILIGIWAFNSHHMNSARHNDNPTSVASVKTTAMPPSATTGARQAPR
jgi:hypothetical protein